MVVAKTVKVRIAGQEHSIRCLTDRSQYADADGRAERAGVPPASWPLFGVLWPAGIALAEEMSAFPVDGKRILEAGCGLALPSLVLKRRGADITATDHHPMAGDFLGFNTELNGLPPIRFRLAGWADADLGRFDLIIGADLLYEPDQPALLASFLERHAAPGAEIVIADPGRRQLAAFRKLMAAENRICTQTRFPPRGRILRFA